MIVYKGQMKKKIFKKIIIFMWRLKKEIILYYRTNRLLNSINKKDNKIFYFGIPAHANLGDLAQGVCIRKWLKKHYPDRTIVEIETNAVVNTHFSLMKRIKKLYMNNDIIVFQSGYTTTDLGGFADEMHRAVMKAFPDARMLMLPQTIYFKDEKNKKRTEIVYNSMGNRLLFLSRDRISYEMAKEMFPNVQQMLYPDIVTTMIGNYNYSGKREGILFCCRNDEEKYYSDEEIDSLMNKCAMICSVEKTDTTKRGNVKDIIKNPEEYIMREVEKYSKYRLIITDRYHGTILSLVAGTPVIVIKTTDHKVTTGVEWFKGVYDEYVKLVQNLDDVYDIACDIYNLTIQKKMYPYFEKEYYDKLPQLFNEKVGM